MDYQVRLSPSARADIEDIVRYISMDDPDQAERFGRFLIHHTRNLGQFPARGRIVPEFKDEFIREIIVRTYRVIYRVNRVQQLIEIIRLWHAGLGIPKLIM